MGTLQQIITKVAPFADRVEGGVVQFLANETIVVSFKLCNATGQWQLVPSMSSWVRSSDTFEKAAVFRAQDFCRRFQEVVS